MPESADHSPKKMSKGGHGDGKDPGKKASVYRLVPAALLALIATGISFFLVGEHFKHYVKDYVKDVSVREILIWLNPAFSEVPDQLLPLGGTPLSERLGTSNTRSSDTASPSGAFDKDNPFCQTAGNAAGPGADLDVSRIPISGATIPSLTQSDMPSLILPEAPRGVETTVKPLAQFAKNSTETEAGDPQAVEKPSSSHSPEQQSGTQNSKIPVASKSSPELAADQQQRDPKLKKGTPDWEATARSEKFQLPGSVLVKIQNYGGTTVLWDLAVILDDSKSMGRQTKSWNPSRFQAAITFIQNLPSALAPGSKIAVRDFVCGDSKDKKESVKGCATRLLIDWTPASGKQWKEVLEKTDYGGSTDCCAAAAFSVRRDFHGGSKRRPRLLIITGGSAVPCASSHVVKAIESSETTKGMVVDVLALGLAKKRQKGFLSLAQKTGGVVLEMDRPADVDHCAKKYAKVVQNKVFEKVEIKNEKVSLTFNPSQEMSIAPGTYTVILPLVEGIDPSRRVIPNVKVSSAETTVIDVAVRKGRPVVRIDKKQ